MAVASETAQRIAPLPMESSSALAAAEPSSPPVTISCDYADSPARSDLSDSSQNPNRDLEIQLALRSEEYRQLFRLPADEVLVQDFNCAFQESILLQGHMYLFSSYICFYSNIFGFETKKIIPFAEISTVKRAKTAGIFPNAIEIFAGEKKYFFASFLSRDEAFKLINDGWMQCVNGTKVLTGEQESISRSESLDIGAVVIEKVNSLVEVDQLDSDDRHKDASPSTDYNLSAPSPVEIETVPVRLTETRENFEKNVEPDRYMNSSSPTRTSTWIEENTDAPEIRKSYTKVGETKFPIKVEEFFNLFISDNANNFIESFHEKCGDKEFKCSLWHPQEKFGYTRDVSFQHPIKLYFGAKFGSCQEVQKFRVYRSSHLIVETSQEVSDVPYGDYFRVEGIWDVVKDDGGSKEGCILQIYVDVAFSKRTVFKGKIVQSTVEECREAYATWINMAHDVLKQKKIERVEEGPSMIQNGEGDSERLVKALDASEISSQSNDDGRTARISGALDDNVRTGNLMQGNFTDATAVTSLLGEYATKSVTFLKSQSQISLVLIVAFVVIFLMQVSIVVLLNRPQNVHVVSPGDYYFGGLMSDKSTEAVAWLERRMHHLKDEMLMVEGHLERLRHEHNWLKSQLKDLDGLEKGK
ncbi:protein VASCULAR ASSOCIATED DEATH 1, chloroplastic [Mercurialis annua]|uniref:protein VASCULAR ASSOCIATED DEATH 1, chloroplastic n=1 Tax=Mercurialis annua TaxID=3986 RepID=UPI002160786B|nr:protein VASCULAR ASSOCIATED DEATH 1, chloroplastic [Mercurialis annua]